LPTASIRVQTNNRLKYNIRRGAAAATKSQLRPPPDLLALAKRSQPGREEEQQRMIPRESSISARPKQETAKPRLLREVRQEARETSDRTIIKLRTGNCLAIMQDPRAETSIVRGTTTTWP